MRIYCSLALIMKAMVLCLLAGCVAGIVLFH